MFHRRVSFLLSGGGVYPSMQWGKGCISQHAMGRGEYPNMQLGGGVPGVCPGGGVSAQGRCQPRGYLTSEVSAQGDGVGCLPRGCLWGGVCPVGGVSATHTPRWLLKWVVRILLEYILFCNCRHKLYSLIGTQQNPCHFFLSLVHVGALQVMNLF